MAETTASDVDDTQAVLSAGMPPFVVHVEPLTDEDSSMSSSSSSSSSSSPLNGTTTTSVLTTNKARELAHRIEQQRTCIGESRRDFYGFPLNADDLDVYREWYEHDVTAMPARAELLEHFFNPSRKATREALALKICESPIPPQHRQRCWSAALRIAAKIDTFPGYYRDLIACDELDVDTLLSADVREQIAKDIARAFPEMQKNRVDYNAQLGRVLRAYARRNQRHGYSQGQNFIAGALLMFMDEEEAFWALAIMSEHVLPNYYTHDMRGILVDSKIFQYYVCLYFRDLHQHLRTHEINLTMHTVEWFMCLYTKTLPIETAFRVWDDVLRNGVAAIFEYGLRIMHLLRTELMAATSAEELNLALMSSPKRIYNFEQLRRIEIKPPLSNAVVDLRRDTLHDRLVKRQQAGASFL